MAMTSVRMMAATLAWLAMAWLAMAGAATAQVSLAPAATEAQTAAPPPAPTPALSTGAAQAQALIDVLRDDAARAALLAELERLAAGAAPDAPPAASAATDAATDAAGAAAPPDQDAAPAEDAAPATVGRRLALLTKKLVEEAQDTADAFTSGLATTQRRLSVLIGSRSSVLIDAARDLALLIVATVALYLLLRRFARWLFRGLREAAQGASILKLCALGGAYVLIDAATVLLAWAAGHAIALGAIGGGADGGVNAALYLNAFLIVQMVKVVIRAVFAPYVSALRITPFTDAGAHYWTGRLGGLVSILGYGMLLVTPIVNQSMSIFTGRAVQVVVFSLVLLWAIAIVIRHRRAPSTWLGARAEAANNDATLRVLATLATVWHWPMLAYLIGLFVTAVSQSGAIEPVLATTAKVVAVLAGGALLGALANRTAHRGLHLPEEMTRQLPLLETRLNEFIARFMGAARLVLLLATLGVAVQVSGLYDVSGWFARRFGDDFAGLMLSVAVIVTFSFLLWLAIASWVDYRLNPDREDKANAREQTLLTLTRNAATIMIVVITLMVTLSEIGLDIAPLLASAGVLGLAIGFGAQRMVQDIITGIFIQFENAINVGDVITVGGVTGTVEKLTIRSVSLRDLQGVYHIIPFSSVDMVSNFMRGFGFHVAEIGIAYRENVAEAKALMFKAFDDVKADPAHGREMLGPLEWHGLTEFGDSAVMVRARIRTRPGSQWAVGRAYNEAVKRRFDEAGVEIPFPHMTVWFGEDKKGAAPPARIAPAAGLAAAATIAAAGQQAGAAAPLSPPPRGQDGPNESDDDGGDDGGGGQPR